MKDFQDYVEPEEGCQGSPQRRGPLTSGPDEENVALPLGNNVLTHNLGIPVLVVCTKVCARELYAWLGLAVQQIKCIKKKNPIKNKQKNGGFQKFFDPSQSH